MDTVKISSFFCDFQKRQIETELERVWCSTTKAMLITAESCPIGNIYANAYLIIMVRKTLV